MSFSKVYTLTSGVLAIADKKAISNAQWGAFDQSNSENILVIGDNSELNANYDQLIETINKRGFKLVISDTFTSIFSAKAINYGIMTIEVSRNYLNKIIESSKKSITELFVDLKGQEVMMLNTGEKEFFDLSDYNKESFECGSDDVEHLYNVWDGLDGAYKNDEILDYAIV